MKALVAAAPIVVAGCTVDYQPYEGRNRFMEGEGGARVTVDGIGIWSNGTPPCRYEILGVLNIDIGDGLGAAGIVRSEAAARVKAAGGNAAIQIAAGQTLSGVVLMPTAAIPTRTLSTRYLVIRYAQTKGGA